MQWIVLGEVNGMLTLRHYKSVHINHLFASILRVDNKVVYLESIRHTGHSDIRANQICAAILFYFIVIIHSRDPIRENA